MLPKKIYNDFIEDINEDNLRSYRFQYVDHIRKLFTIKPEKRDNVVIKL